VFDQHGVHQADSGLQYILVCTRPV
jgi:hypothetical protein